MDEWMRGWKKTAIPGTGSWRRSEARTGWMDEWMRGWISRQRGIGRSRLTRLLCRWAGEWGQAFLIVVIAGQWHTAFEADAKSLSALYTGSISVMTGLGTCSRSVTRQSL